MRCRIRFLDLFELGNELTLLPIYSASCGIGEKDKFRANLGKVSKYLERLGALDAYDSLVIFEILLDAPDISTFITVNYSKFIEARDSCQNLVHDALKDEVGKLVFKLGAAIGQYQVLVGMESKNEELEKMKFLIKLSIIELIQEHQFPLFELDNYHEANMLKSEQDVLILKMKISEWLLKSSG